MSRFVITLFSLFIFLTTLPAQPLPEWNTIFKMINQEVLNSSEAYANLQTATNTIGHRLTGSPEGTKAEDNAYQLLKSYGLNVRYAPFEAESWSRGTLEVTIHRRKYKAVSLAHSPIKADISGDLVDMGNGLENDYNQNSVKANGKIVFVSLGIIPGSPKGLRNLHRSEKTSLAIRHGAKGIIFFNAAPGDILLTGTASVTGKLIDIPAVCISNNDGMTLKKKMKSQSGIMANIKMTNFSGKISARNVIASLPGKASPKEKIIIGGHLDSWDLATGAIDNGIGAFSVIDIARTFTSLNLHPKRTIEFVLFMGEEQGLLGSRAYLNNSMKDGTIDQIKYMINLDMSNDPTGFIATTDADQSLFDRIGKIVKENDSSFSNTFHSGLGLHSDHQPFMLQGIPTGSVAGRLSKEALNCYHADCDSFDLVHEKELINTIRIGAMLLYGLADAPTLNAVRLSDEELKVALIQSNLKEPLKIAGDWRWDD